MQFSIVNFSQIDKKLFRLEAEFYKPIYLDIENRFATNPNLLEKSNRIVCGPFGSTILDETYTNDGVKVIRPFNLKNYQIEKDNIVYIARKDIEKKQLKIFSKGTIFFSRVGDIKCGVLTKDELITISPNIIAVDINQEEYNAYFLTLFFNSKYGYLQILRELKISAQPTISTERLQQLKLPLISPSFQKYIGGLFKKATDWVVFSEKKYQEAQDLLLTELGLNDWQPKHQLTFIKNYSDTIHAERIDAEYFQPKYDEIINAIKAYRGGYSTIRKEFRQNKSTFETDDEKLYQYVEIGSINVSNGEITPSEVLGANLPANAKRTLNKNDIIVSKVRTYRGAITIVEKDGYVGSGAFIALTEDGRVNKETLLAFIHSKPLLSWSLKPNTGTSYPVIVDDDILNLPIPILPQAKQLQIQQKVTESFKLRKQSKQLLENAKRAVEIAIEQDESKAIQWLETQSV